MGKLIAQLDDGTEDAEPTRADLDALYAKMRDRLAEHRRDGLIAVECYCGARVFVGEQCGTCKRVASVEAVHED